MLRIHHDQKETLAAHGFARFLRAATEHVAGLGSAASGALGSARLGSGGLATWVAQRVDRAQELGLDDEHAILCWLEVAAAHGDTVAEDAFVVHLLADPRALADWPRTRALVDATVAADARAPEDT